MKPKGFLVINHKFIAKLSDEDQFQLAKIANKIKCPNSYLVVNKDEPYADQVLKLIKNHEV